MEGIGDLRARPGGQERDLALSWLAERTQVLVGVCLGGLDVGCTPGYGWSLPPRSSNVSWPLPPSARHCAGRMSAVTPSSQSGIARVIRDGAVSRPPLIAGVTLEDCCRVRRVRRACLRLVACAREGRGFGHGSAVAGLSEYSPLRSYPAAPRAPPPAARRVGSPVSSNAQRPGAGHRAIAEIATTAATVPGRPAAGLGRICDRPCAIS